MHRRRQIYKDAEKINYFVYMDDVKISALKWKELESLYKQSKSSAKIRESNLGLKYIPCL